MGKRLSLYFILLLRLGPWSQDFLISRREQLGYLKRGLMSFVRLAYASFYEFSCKFVPDGERISFPFH